MATRRIQKRIRVDRPGLHVHGDVNAVLAINDRRQTGMTDSLPQPADQDPHELSQREELSPEELEQQEGEALPDREAMSLINANVAAPVNAAVALNALSDGSVAYADATQEGTITQTN
jgi:hypothetical protein